MTETNIDRQIQNIIHKLSVSKSVVRVFEDRYDHDFRYENGFDPHDHIRALLSAAVEVAERFNIDPEWMLRYLKYKIERGVSVDFINHDEDPSHTVFPEGGNLRPPSQSGRSSDEAELATVGRASPHPGMRVGSNPTAPTHEKEVEP